MSTAPFVIERIFNAPISTVWAAVSHKEIMKQWYFDLPDFRPEVGFGFQFTGGNEDRTFLHLCTITKAMENKVLAYTWRYDGYPGISEVTFELFDEDGKTRLKLTHEGLESFPATPFNDFAKENFAAGWTHIIGTSLREFLENSK